MILVTGGLGYIGSHTVVELIDSGYEVIIIDNLSNSSIDVLEKLKKITLHDIKFYQGDVCNKELLREKFKENVIVLLLTLKFYRKFYILNLFLCLYSFLFF